MTEQRGREGLGEARTAVMVSTVRDGVWVAFAGHVLVVVVVATGALGRNPATVAGIAWSIVAVMALMELGVGGVGGRRVVALLIGGQGVAAVVMLAGGWAGAPAVLLAGLGGALALGAAGLVVAGRVSVESGVRPVSLAPRVAVVALLGSALVRPWLASATGLSVRLHAAILIGLGALGVALLASMSVIAIRTRRRWAVVGLAAWTVGWVAVMADLGGLIGWTLGGVAPMGPHQLREVDAGLVHAVATVGGLGVGAAIAGSFADLRTRHSAVVLLVGYAVFGLLVARTEHRIELVMDFPGLTALQRDRDLASAIQSFALAALMWRRWRQRS